MRYYNYISLLDESTAPVTLPTVCLSTWRPRWGPMTFIPMASSRIDRVYHNLSKTILFWPFFWFKWRHPFIKNWVFTKLKQSIGLRNMPKLFFSVSRNCSMDILHKCLSGVNLKIRLIELHFKIQCMFWCKVLKKGRTRYHSQEIVSSQPFDFAQGIIYPKPTGKMKS